MAGRSTLTLDLFMLLSLGLLTVERFYSGSSVWIAWVTIVVLSIDFTSLSIPVIISLFSFSYFS